MLIKNNDEEIDIYKGVVDFIGCSIKKTTVIKDIDSLILELELFNCNIDTLCYTSQVLISKNKTLRELKKTANKEIKDFISKNQDAFMEIKPIKVSKQVFEKIINIPDRRYLNDEKEYLLFKKLDSKSGIIIINERTKKNGD